MFRRFMITCAALSVLAAAGIAAKEKTVMVGGAARYAESEVADFIALLMADRDNPNTGANP